MGILSKLFGRQKYDDEMFAKFKEFEEQFTDNQEMISVAKALWLTSRGTFFGRKGKFDLAISDFNLAMHAKEDHIPAFIGLSLVYKEMKRYDEALFILSKAPSRTVIMGERLTGFDFDLYNVIGSIYLLMGKKQQTIEYVKKAIEAADSPDRARYIEYSKLNGIDGVGDGDTEMRIVLKQLLVKLENE